MNLYVLDTDHVTLHQHGHPQVTARIHATFIDQLATTVVTVEEQMRGRLAQLGKADNRLPIVYSNLYATSAYFCDLTILPFDSDAQQTFLNLRTQKIRIGTLELRIATIVLRQNAILVTRNRRDFSQVPELQIEDWS